MRKKFGGDSLEEMKRNYHMYVESVRRSDVQLSIIKNALFLVLALAVAGRLSAAGTDSAPRARAMAKEAYDTIRHHPFEGAILEQSARKLDQAHALNEKEPYIWLGAAELIMVSAYHSGRVLDSRNYDAGAVNRALPLVQHALQLDDKLVDAHVQAGMLYLMQGRFTDSLNEFDTGHTLEPTAFRPVYFQAVWQWRQGNDAKCQEALRAARTLASGEWDQAALLSQLEQMAEAHGDEAQQEKILKALIQLHPNSPWTHGNYAAFLYNKQRFDDAVVEFEKAVALGSYPIAEEYLKRARQAARPGH